ncbi:hypothetical protein WDW89_07125 [Deltaproteobacteria bacterium TL4]
MGVTLALEGTIDYAHKVVYRYNTGVHYIGTPQEECLGLGDPQDLRDCMEIRADEFRTSSASVESSYQEKLPMVLGLGFAWTWNRLWLSLDLEIASEVTYPVKTLGVNEVLQDDGSFLVELEAGEYTGKKIVVVRPSVGMKVQIWKSENIQIALLAGYYNNPTSREFDEKNMSKQIGARAVNYTGTTLGVALDNASGKKFIGIMSVTGDGETLVDGAEQGYEKTTFQFTEMTIVLTSSQKF